MRRALLSALVERKRKGRTIQAEDEDAARPAKASGVDLMAAFKRSLDSSDTPELFVI